MKKIYLLILIILLALPAQALADECDQIQNRDLRHLCTGETVLIDDFDLRQWSADNCDLIRSADMRNACMDHRYQINDPDLLNLTEGRCILIRNDDMRHLCNAWNREK